MVNFYFNEKGEKVLIANMPDAYLLNSYVSKKKRKALIESRVKPGEIERVSEHLASLQDIIDSLLAEIKRRNLILDNSV